MSRTDARRRAMGIMARIQAATARHDPSYKLKKRGMLNAHDMKRLIPASEELMQDVKIGFNWTKDLTDAEKVYILNDIDGNNRAKEALSVLKAINSTEFNRHVVR